MGAFSRALKGLPILGLDLRKMRSAVTGIPWLMGQAKAYRRADRDSGFPLRWSNAYPIFTERHAQAGSFSHYFWQDLWAARKIHERRPQRHTDIGSRIDGFIAHLLVFMPVEQLDIRPVDSPIRGLSFTQADATNLDNFADNSIDSLSTLHAVEHFGLGRYGDPIDPQACFKAMAALQRVLAPEGRLYFGTPVGRQRLEFNCQRIFSPRTILDRFSDLQLVSFSAVDDELQFHEDADPADFENCRFGCGLFEFTKAG